MKEERCRLTQGVKTQRRKEKKKSADGIRGDGISKKGGGRKQKEAGLEIQREGNEECAQSKTGREGGIDSGNSNAKSAGFTIVLNLSSRQGRGHTVLRTTPQRKGVGPRTRGVS